MATVGTGWICANDVLTDISYICVEQVVNANPTIGFANGNPGALIIVGYGQPSQEVVLVISTTATTFTAVFANAHPATDTLTGATFPTCQTNNEFFQQSEVLTYLAEAQNDYLLRVKCILNRVPQNWTFTMKTNAQPADCIQLQRVAVSNYATPPIYTALREQPQSSLDLLQPNWQQQGYNQPKIWYEDRVGNLTYGVWPATGNAFTAYLLYAQRDTSPLGLTDGFLLPDPFLTYVKYGTLAKMLSKDGQQADPARAKYFTQRFEAGCTLGAKFMAMAESPVNEVQQNG